MNRFMSKHSSDHCAFFLSRSLFHLAIDAPSCMKLMYTGADYPEPPSPIQALGVNPFRRRIIFRTGFPAENLSRPNALSQAERSLVMLIYICFFVL